MSVIRSYRWLICIQFGAGESYAHQLQKPEGQINLRRNVIFVCLKYKQKGNLQTGENICINNTGLSSLMM